MNGVQLKTTEDRPAIVKRTIALEKFVILKIVIDVSLVRSVNYLNSPHYLFVYSNGNKDNAHYWRLLKPDRHYQD